MADGELNWKIWSEMCLRELSQLRLDINRHLTEHREDVTRLNNRIDSLSEKFQEMTKQIDGDRRDADEKQNLAIQSLQIKAEHAGKAAGAEAGAAKAKEESAKYSVIISAVVAGITQIIQFIMSLPPPT
jgi:TolA-binding protein